MRRIVLAIGLAAVAQGAQAADLPDLSDLPILRGGFSGETPPARWEGYYVGGQAAYGSADMNFSGSNDALIARALGPNNIITGTAQSVGGAFGKLTTHQAAFGGFAGYNGQWDDVVLGVEANYMHGNFKGSSTVAPVPLTYVTPFSDGNYHTIGLNSSRTVSITDVGTIRARAGYAVGNFLPYVFGGFALGRADISSDLTITDRSAATLADSPSAPATVYTATDGISGKMLYGYTAGLGTEAMLFGNIFARAEWEYVRFVNAGADVNINTVRGGLGYKF